MRPADDRQIRSALHTNLAAEHAQDGSLILDELGIYGGATRVDVAVINGRFGGYEIKSDRDTLERLPTQAELYGRVFDTMSLVAGPRHIDRAVDLLPAWWGVVLAAPGEDGGALLETIRTPQENRGQDPQTLAWCLWRAELAAVLSEHGYRVMSRHSRPHLVRMAAELFSLDHLRRIVRETVKARGDWRAAP